MPEVPSEPPQIVPTTSSDTAMGTRGVAAARAEIDEVLGDRTPTIDDIRGMRYLRLVVAETLRMYPEPPLLIRRCRTENELPAGGGRDATVIRGMDIFLSLYNLHRDGRFWPEPDVFRPERWLTKYVNPDVPSTLEAAALCKMADRGQILGGLVEGPLAMDNAVDMAAARIKGRSYWGAVWGHAFPNIMVPLITVVALSYAYLLEGSVLTETIFAWPGMGAYVVNSIQALDFPAVMGFAILVSFIYVLLNMAIDLLYRVIDPRIGVALLHPAHAAQHAVVVLHRLDPLRLDGGV